MAPVNKTEAIGIFFSIAVMAMVLAYLRFDTIGTAVSTIDPASQSAVVVVSEEGDQTAALANAIVDGASATGALERLIIDDVSRGTGPEVKEGDSITVNYIGRLQNGQEFDNSYSSGRPFTFTVGNGDVIEGWDLGVVGMQADGQRVLVIPPELGYGSQGFGPIPGGATLIFAIELVSIN